MFFVFFKFLSNSLEFKRLYFCTDASSYTFTSLNDNKNNIMKRLLLPVLILSFSFASAQDIVSNEEVSEDNVTVISSEDVINDNENEIAYTAKTLRDPDNIDFDNLHRERQLELFITETKQDIC